MKPDERLDELVGRALREVDVVPPTPREEMWARIQAERSARADGVVVRPLRPRVQRTWVPWSAAIAATLVLGIGLGRISMQTEPEPVAPAPVAAEAPEIPAAYRLAAAQHMQRTETLLTSLAVSAGTGPAEMSRWARELLTDTRLLLGSPAADDPVMRRLLEDLELVLLQIAGIPAGVAKEEVELIQNGINQSDVLLRLRAATAGPALVGT